MALFEIAKPAISTACVVGARVGARATVIILLLRRAAAPVLLWAALGAASLMAAAPALAQDATWLASPTVAGPTAGTFDFNANANWTPATAPGSVSNTGTATFGATNSPNISFSAVNTFVDGFTFTAAASNYAFTIGNSPNFLIFNGAGIVINGGSATFTNNHDLDFNNSSTAGSAAITNNGNLYFDNTSTAGNAAITNNGYLSFFGTSTAGSAVITNGTNGSLFFFSTSTAGNAAITNNGDINFYDTSTAGSAAITNNGSIEFSNTSTAGSAAITNNSILYFYNTSTAGNAAITNNSAGVADFSGSTGPNNDHKLSAGSIAGGGQFYLGNDQLTVGGNNLSTAVSGIISDCGPTGTDCYNYGATGGALVKSGTGTLTFSGVNTYTGATTVNAGTLNVTGSISPSSLVTVNSGGTLAGTGMVGNTDVTSGGALAPGSGTPGTSLKISGSLAFTSGALYVVHLNPATASFANVFGTATLAGTVVADPLSRLTQKTAYTILTSGGLGNTTFGNVTVANNFATNPVLSYSGGNVLLTLGPGLLAPMLPGNANGNQVKVASAIDNSLLAGNNLSNAFGAIFNLSGNGLLNGLTQLSGETATGSQQTTFDAMGQFMGVMTDPFMGRSGGLSGSSLSSGYADEAPGHAANKTSDAFAMFTKASAPAATFEPRWSVWAASFGGSQTTDGNTATGSNNATSRIFGTAVGADYLLAPTTIAGFALAGGGTNFSVANGGTGRSDLFQAGAYVRHTNGPAYVSAALAYGWQDITTDRTVTVAGLDHLRAEFNANAFSGRVEGGYRFVTPWSGGIGITPYAAAQFVTLDLPAYAEQAIVGLNTFALAYGARNVTDPRSELGIRTDKSFALADGILTLRGRFAWAHDYEPDRTIGATFQALPGASFVVNGAAQASDSALATLSIERKWKNGWSALATFEGEFSNVTQSYAGKGVVRYTF